MSGTGADGIGAGRPPEVRAARDGFEILLGGAVVRLPDGVPLQPRTRALADAIAAECGSAGLVGGVVAAVPDALTLTRLQATLQGIANQRGAALGSLLRFCASDLLCYRALGPPSLVARETEVWDAWLEWAGRMAGARFSTATGVMPLAQPDAVVAGVRRWLERLDDREITCLCACVPALGSLVLGLAVVTGSASPTNAASACLVGEAFAAERFGDTGDLARSTARLVRLLEAVDAFLRLSGGPA